MGADPDVILGRLALGRKYVTSEQVRSAMAARGGTRRLDEVLLDQGFIDDGQRAELIEARDTFLGRQGDAGAEAVGATAISDPTRTAVRGAAPAHAGLDVTAGEDEPVDIDATPGTLDKSGVTIDEYSPGTDPDAGRTIGEEEDDDGVGRLEGQVVGGCRIGRKLGQGGMGAVYEAEHVALAKRVAIKVIASAAGPTNALVQRFQREARAAARLQHPNIVAVFDVGHDKGFHYIQMEFIEGRSVRDLIADESLDLDESVRILRESLKGLEAAHQQNLVHRDIKPDNILVSDRGEVKIADFGLARSVEDESLEITRSGQILGTPHFMSPEQCDGQKTDARTDVYSLGVTMWTMLAGEKPFVGDTAMAILMKHLHEEPPPLRERVPDVPEDLENIIGKMMAKDLPDRYASAQAVLDDLDLWDSGGKVAAPVRRRRRRRGSGLLVATLLVLLLAGGGAFAFVQGWIPGLTPPAPSTGPGPAPREQTALDQARKHLNSNEHAAAIPLLEEWCKQHPGDAAAQALLRETQFQDAYQTGKKLLFDARFDDAIEHLRASVELAPSASLKSKAQGDLDRALSEKATTERKAGVAGALDEANGHMKAGKWELAVAALDRALAADSENRVAQSLKRDAQRHARAAATLADARGKVERADALLTRDADPDQALPVLGDAEAQLGGIAADVRDEPLLATERTQLADRVGKLRGLANFLRVQQGAASAESSSRWVDAATAYETAAGQAPDEASAGAMREKAAHCRGKQADRLVADGEAALEGNDVPGALDAFRRALDLRADPALAARTRTLVERATTPEGMLYVAAGAYAAGSPHSRDNNPEQAPVELPSFYLGQTEVTNAEYARFVAAGGYATEAHWDPDGWAARASFTDRTGTPGPATWSDGHPPAGREKHPVIGVCWFEARAYARWRRGRLPTEVEWERAAAFDAGVGRRRDYPWGDDWREGFAALGGPPDGTHAVGTHTGDKSPIGCLDMAGNAHEWTDSTFERSAAVHAVARGGGVGTPSPEPQSRLLRRWVMPLRTYRAGALGFRLAADPARTGEGR